MNYYNSETLLEQQQDIEKLKEQNAALAAQNAELSSLLFAAEKQTAQLTLIAFGELSLNQVRADAGRAGFIAGYMLCNDDSPLIKHNYEGFANQYHASILAGKE